MKYEFTYYNLELIESSFSFVQNQEFVKTIISVLKKINFDNIEIGKSYIEILENKKYGNGIYFNLISNTKKCIPINICIYENYIDMIVDSETTIYEMYKVTNLNKFINNFNKWFENILIKKTFVRFGFQYITKITDFNNNILFKKTVFFYSSYLNGNQSQKKFNPWIM